MTVAAGVVVSLFVLDHQGQRGGAALLELSQRAPTPNVAGETTVRDILVYYVVIRGFIFLVVLSCVNLFFFLPSRSSVAKYRNSNESPNRPP